MMYIKTFEGFNSEENDDKDVNDEMPSVESTEDVTPSAVEPEMPAQETGDMKNYMFFQNLKTLKSHLDVIMKMDQTQIDHLIGNGHDWAADHISTAKDDVEEVCDWLCAKLNK